MAAVAMAAVVTEEAAMAVVATVAEHTVLTHTHHYHRMDPRVWHPCSWADPQSE